MAIDSPTGVEEDAEVRAFRDMRARERAAQTHQPAAPAPPTNPIAAQFAMQDTALPPAPVTPPASAGEPEPVPRPPPAAPSRAKPAGGPPSPQRALASIATDEANAQQALG